MFSFEDEALLYLHMEELGSGWRARVTMAGELLSMLLRPFSGIRWIALDPLPGLLGRHTLGLVSLRREDFVRTLIGGREARVTSPSRNLLPVPGPACSPEHPSVDRGKEKAAALVPNLVEHFAPEEGA